MNIINELKNYIKNIETKNYSIELVDGYYSYSKEITIIFEILKNQEFKNIKNINYNDIKEKDINLYTLDECISYLNYIWHIEATICPGIVMKKIKTGDYLKCIHRLKKLLIENDVNEINECMLVTCGNIGNKILKKIIDENNIKYSYENIEDVIELNNRVIIIFGDIKKYDKEIKRILIDLKSKGTLTFIIGNKNIKNELCDFAFDVNDEELMYRLVRDLYSNFMTDGLVNTEVEEFIKLSEICKDSSIYYSKQNGSNAMYNTYLECEKEAQKLYKQAKGFIVLTSCNPEYAELHSIEKIVNKLQISTETKIEILIHSTIINNSTLSDCELELIVLY